MEYQQSYMRPVSFVLKGSYRIIKGISFYFFFLFLPPLLHSAEKRNVSHPSKFKVSYSLQRTASSFQPAPNSRRAAPAIRGNSSSSSSEEKVDIAVNILDERFYPVKTFVLRGIKQKQRVESLWDGRDIQGREMPKGNYYASLSITYADGSKESKFFKFVKE